MGVSSRRVGVPELDREGEAYWKSRRFVGVDGITEVDVVGRLGDTGRRAGEGGVTSVCNIEVKIELACSITNFVSEI